MRSRFYYDRVIIIGGACVGRQAELAEIYRRSAATSIGGAAVIAVVGPAGIGKTALLRQIAASPHALWASAAEWESGTPGAVLKQLLQADVPEDPAAAAGLLAARIGTESALIVIDDAEYLDQVSAQALAGLVRKHRNLPVLVVFGAACTDRLISDLITAELRLEGLDGRAVAELAGGRGRAVHPAMAHALACHTGGNPREVLALLDELPPETWSRPDTALPASRRLTSAVQVKLQQCGAETAALVYALAVLGDEGTLDEAAQLAGLADPLVAIDEATAAALVSWSPDHQVRLRDSLTRAAVLELMGAHAAADAHRRAAQIVNDPVRRLRHRVASTPTADPQLADDLESLARQRGDEGAWAQSAALLRDASRLTADRLLSDDRLMRSVDALVAAGDCAGAATMLPAVESLRETPLRNAVLGYLAILRGRAAEAEIRLQRAWDIVNFDREPEMAALIAQRNVLHSLMRGRGDQVLHWSQRALELASADSAAAIEASAIRGLGYAMVGDPVAAARTYDALVESAHGAQGQRLRMGQGWLQLTQDDIDASRSSLETAVATAALGGSSRIMVWALAWLARVHFVTGDWDHAMTAADRGRELAASSGITLMTPLLEWTAAQVHALRGEWGEAEDAARRSDAVTQDYALMRIPAALTRAQIAEAQADYGKVRRSLEPLRRMQQSGVALQEPGLWPWADVLGNALVLDGRVDEADEFLRPHEARAAEQGRRSTMARLNLARGRVLGARGDFAAAAERFETALELLEGLPLRVDSARAAFAYGQTLRRAGRRRDADAVLQAAREQYQALGAVTYVLRCERELKAGGVHPIRGSRGHVDLTPQEEAVTDLVSRGLSNREVAAELFVSTKTVSYHLTRIYTKLGVRSRSELAAIRR